MRREIDAVRLAQVTLLSVVVAATAYLAVLAVAPAVRDGAPDWLRWFGGPGSGPTIAVVAVGIVALCAIAYRYRAAGSVSLSIVLALTAMNCVLGMAAYWNCHDAAHPMFITPLMWTAQLVKGSTSELKMSTGADCPVPIPVALDVARLSALAVIFLGVASVAVALFRVQVDRVRARTARTVTVVVGVDADSRSMVSAVAGTLEPGSQLVLLADNVDQPVVVDCRTDGARVMEAALDNPESLAAVPLWQKLDRLYLLHADPSTNLARLHTVGQARSARGTDHRLPLIVRIDDPWYAAAWRAQQSGGSDNRWAADAVGKYEVTARRLLDEIAERDGVSRVLVCGTSPLILALCADLEQRRREHAFCPHADHALPAITVVAESAQEYANDHRHRQRQLGLPSDNGDIDAVAESPAMPVLTRLIGEARDAGGCAVIFVDTDPMFGAAVDPTIATRLAMRFPDVPIFAWNPTAAGAGEERPGIDALRTYRLTMDLPAGQAHDAWERAAMLIHERYRRTVGGESPARRPWAELDEFYRGSNRRQVRNALRLVEQIGGHTWNSLDRGDALESTPPSTSEPLEQLEAMGFDRSAALAMAQAEHEDWCRYYRKAGWAWGEVRDDARKTHPNLTEWRSVEDDPERLRASLVSLAATLSQLHEFGYRSVPKWRRYRRVGEVIAEQRSQPWTWTSDSGHEMHACAGDWLVRDDGGSSWSVRDDIFRATYQRVGENRWRRAGLVSARPAMDGEVVDTLEGTAEARSGGWIVQGETGERWPVSAGEFRRRYEGPVD